MEQMEAPDGQAVPVSREDHHLARRPGSLQPDGRGNRPAMEDLEDVGMHINRDPGAATDSRGQSQVIDDPQLIHRLQKGLDDHAVPAAGTEDKGKKIFP